MDKPFRGRFEAKIDPKGRLSIPKALQESISTTHSDIVITNSQFRGENHLDVYPLTEWQKLEARIAKLPPLKAEVQAFRRFYLASGQVVSPDKMGRALVPSPLRKYADLSGEVVLVGMGEKFEIWSASVWNKLFANLSEDFEQVMAAVADLDRGED